MCQAPTHITSKLPPYSALVPCRYCWQCLADRTNDFVGRCIAEEIYSTKTVAVTLTYADNSDPATVALRYRDVQLMLKKLRSAGYKVRYVVAGEYGSLKGRAHWHAILFFDGKSPDFTYDKEKWNWTYWRHGYTFAQRPEYKAFSYAMKYALKDIGDNRVGHFAMSKKPLIGAQFITEWANEYVRDGLVPQDLEYSFAHVKKKGERQKFRISGASADLFIKTYLDGYADKYGDYPPESEMLKDYFNDHSELYVDEKLVKRSTEAWQKAEDLSDAKISRGVLYGRRCTVISHAKAGVIVYFQKEEMKWLVRKPGTIEKLRLAFKKTAVTFRLRDLEPRDATSLCDGFLSAKSLTFSHWLDQGGNVTKINRYA